MSEQKTVRQWLEELPEPQRSKSIYNSNIDLEDMATSIPDALMQAFSWYNSPEGEAYWIDVYKSLNTK